MRKKLTREVRLNGSLSLEEVEMARSARATRRLSQVRRRAEADRITGSVPFGWMRDHDLWLCRELQPGDAPDGAIEDSMGFVEGNRVYARNRETALDYDAKRRAPTPFIVNVPGGFFSGRTFHRG